MIHMSGLVKITNYRDLVVLAILQNLDNAFALIVPCPKLLKISSESACQISFGLFCHNLWQVML